MTPTPSHIALLGGSFDPPHKGHLHITRQAMKQLNIANAIWILTEQNPSKAHKPAPTQTRYEACKALLQNDPHIIPMALEQEWGFRYSIDVVKKLQDEHKTTRFIWIMGSDNFITLHHWKSWQDFMKTIAIYVYPRGESATQTAQCEAGQVFAKQKLADQDIDQLRNHPPPLWGMGSGAQLPHSSKAIRKA